MTEKQNQQGSGDELIEALLEKYGRSREAILGENGLLADLKKRVEEKALAGGTVRNQGGTGDLGGTERGSEVLAQSDERTAQPRS